MPLLWIIVLILIMLAVAGGVVVAKLLWLLLIVALIVAVVALLSGPPRRSSARLLGLRLMGLLLRSWNLFHGNAVPPERRAFLEDMVRLGTADGPDVLCLQEVPVWALRRLADWSGMQALGEVAAPAADRARSRRRRRSAGC